MTPLKHTVDGFVPIIDGAGHIPQQIGPVCETEDEARAWVKRAVKADPTLKGKKIVIAKGSVTFDVFGLPV